MRSVHLAHHRRRGERGVTLIIALIVLVIIGLTSASVMRGALSTDLVANNTRTQTLAMQAAQIGLRYCEQQADLDASGTNAALPVNPPDYWNSLANWSQVAVGINEVPQDYMESVNSTFKPSTLPQCMVQKVTLPTGGKTAYQVTARGFSPDYSADGGATVTGSVVWLQSYVYMQ